MLGGAVVLVRRHGLQCEQRFVNAPLALPHRVGASRTSALRLCRRTRFPVYVQKLLKLLVHTLDDRVRVPEPVRRPDPDDRPTQPFEHGLANLVAVSGGR